MSKVSYYNSFLFEIYAPTFYEMFDFKHTETIEYVKKSSLIFQKNTKLTGK